MTDQEKHALSEKIAKLAEAQGINPALLWEVADVCPQSHLNWDGEDKIVGMGERCAYCESEWWNTHLDLDDEDAIHLLNDPAFESQMFMGRQAKDLTDPAILLLVVEAWKEAQHLLVVRLAFGKTDQWRGYLQVDIPSRERWGSLVESHDYPGYGQSWGEAVAQAVCLALESERGLVEKEQ